MTLIFVTLLVGLGGGLFAGLLVCANTTLGNFSFTHPARDLSRCAVIALVVGAATVGLLALSRNPRVFAALLPVWYLAVKLCWLEIEPVEMAILGASCIVALALASSLAAALLR